ncbi:histone acetyltransferase KAT7-like [Brevipalpus obovatus]|uniref:histone acetyltransferase KAT7-like n=1 Tax=Brevipalpus obovatus TaxID=246614 RepID=UPI003D9FA7D5
MCKLVMDSRGSGRGRGRKRRTTESSSGSKNTTTTSNGRATAGIMSPKRSKLQSATTTTTTAGSSATTTTGGGIDDENNGHGEDEEVRCRIPDCDSRGHLSGKHKGHHITSTCPIFHNLTPSDCERMYQKRMRRRKTIECGSGGGVNKISTRKSPHKEDKLNNLMEQRKKEMSQLINSPGSRKNNLGPRASREPDLKSLTPVFDYEMFREAQSRAAELVQEQIKEEPPKRSGIKAIEMGKYEMDVWYSSPYPPDYSCLPKLYICEFCLKYFNSSLTVKRHVSKCPLYCPPGDEIYRKGNISVFEIDGEKNKLYCQNLCLLAKLFLDHKTLYYDVEPFRFYIMTESDTEGFHIIGYFSKEKSSFLNYNVSCILTLPPYQKQGYGRMLIDFSYLLTKVEGKVGSPEKPLSDLGLISYRSYWKSVIMEYLCNYQGNEISIKDLSHETAMNAYDIVSTLQALGMLKYWKGKHLVLTRKDVLDEYRSKNRRKKNIKSIDSNCLKWEKPQEPKESNGK